MFSKSFEEWCLDNNRKDILDRWDYNLNNIKPVNLSFSSNKKFYFECPNKLHNSELKRLSDFTSGHNGVMDCKACNSFAQWGINNLGESFLKEYWDYEKNKDIDPWEISKSGRKKVYIKCQEKDYHESYPVSVHNFSVNNTRCPYCRNNCGVVNILDSLGSLYSITITLWSDKNNKTPFEYTSKSNQKVWWRCEKGEHKDYLRSIKVSNMCDFRCPYCQTSKGELQIENILKKSNILYTPQKEFIGLTGINNGNLSYDFYLPDYNLLIEYQGEQHDHYIKGFHKSKKDFEKQQEHDKRKKEYAINNNIKLLEIWYWDFDRIEEIFQKEFIRIRGNYN